MIKCQQHLVFPGGHPSRYWPDPTLLNFADRTRSGAFSVVWPLALEDVWKRDMIIHNQNQHTKIMTFDSYMKSTSYDYPCAKIICKNHMTCHIQKCYAWIIWVLYIYLNDMQESCDFICENNRHEYYDYSHTKKMQELYDFSYTMYSTLLVSCMVIMGISCSLAKW